MVEHRPQFEIEFPEIEGIAARLRAAGEVLGALAVVLFLWWLLHYGELERMVRQ